MAIFQCFKHGWVLWLHPLGACSVHILSWNGELEGMKGRAVVELVKLLTDWVVVFIVFFGRKKRVFCCGWNSFVCFFSIKMRSVFSFVGSFVVWGEFFGKVWDGVGRSMNGGVECWGQCRECGFFIVITCHLLFVLRKWLETKTIMSAWKIWVLKQQ